MSQGAAVRQEGRRQIQETLRLLNKFLIPWEDGSGRGLGPSGGGCERLEKAVGGRGGGKSEVLEKEVQGQGAG